MKITVYDITGKAINELTLNKDVFGVEINENLLTQAVRVYQDNQRTGNAKTLTRSEINRTTKKVYKQKGTGGARHGSRKAPIYVGGGVAHGPRGNQNYTLKFPKKMKISALKNALSQAVKNKKIYIIDGLTKITKPSTKTVSTFLNKILDNNIRNAAIVFDKDMDNATKSFKNIKSVDCITVNNLTTFEVIKSKSLILSLEAMKSLVERLIK